MNYKILMLVVTLIATLSAAATSAEKRQTGQQLFTKHWSVGDDSCRLGDGLGPMFNARSCADCHNQGGLGGGGDENANTDILNVDRATLRALARTSSSSNRFVSDLTSLHPSFRLPSSGNRRSASAVSSIILHSQSTNPRYSKLREGLLSKVVARDDTTRLGLLEAAKEITEQFRNARPPIQFELTHRNTPALFGAGIMDRIPEEALEQTVAKMSRKFPQVSGRIAKVGPKSRAGRFGWRAQTASLDEFVRGACANELGLQVRDNPQPMSPTNPEMNPSLEDLSDRQCRDLVRYVSNLPQPIEAAPTSGEAVDLVAHGHNVFRGIGCVACHVENLGQAEGIYADLALHDMGAELSDPWPAPSATPSSGSSSGSPALPSLLPAYYGSQDSLLTAFTSAGDRPNEWRTPPLWGVADSAPYLHDGRAKTLTAAIVAHAGEASFSSQQYLSLAPSDRSALLTFLRTLKAPSTSEEPKSGLAQADRKSR